MAKKMTEGRPLPLIMGFAVPLLVGNILQQTYNIIDAAIVGRALGANALASVGASSSVQFLVLGFCIGVACGFGVPIAKSAGNEKSYFPCNVSDRCLCGSVDGGLCTFLSTDPAYAVYPGQDLSGRI